MLIDRIKEEHRTKIEAWVKTHTLLGSDIIKSLEKEFVNDLTIYEALMITRITDKTLGDIYSLFNDL